MAKESIQSIKKLPSTSPLSSFIVLVTFLSVILFQFLHLNPTLLRRLVATSFRQLCRNSFVHWFIMFGAFQLCLNAIFSPQLNQQYNLSIAPVPATRRSWHSCLLACTYDMPSRSMLKTKQSVTRAYSKFDTHPYRFHAERFHLYYRLEWL